MGGWNSGRRGGSPTVESSLELDIARLIRPGSFRPGLRVAGTLTWSNSRTGEKTAAIGYEACLISQSAASARLTYRTNDKPMDYRVRIEATPCNFGGSRWWWICPLSGRRASKLYLPNGATVFAARESYRLAYRSQREGPMDRTHAWQARIHRKLGGDYRLYGDLPPRRRKGMHHTTYERLTAELETAMEAHERVFQIGSTAILARLRKADARRG